MTFDELNYPPELPVTEHREEILAALKAHPVVIVCGDTGSGKTTQLPKMAMEVWERGRVEGEVEGEGEVEVEEGGEAGGEVEGSGRKRGGARRIACTQPRRLAAVSMAERVAAELKTETGRLVGYRHRFEKKISSETRIEFMTDGVLLAETRFDPLLRAYDTIIVDEAHERSLNIDFLLGILKRILVRRRDLKVIISSATLDAAGFSKFFDDAPVVSVPGRLYPIEIRHRPVPDGEELDLPRDIARAVNELPSEHDILVFLPGERDIRETAEYLEDARGHRDDVIPLLASLPAAEQRRAFRPSPKRRIILATNVAETSVTIPGIRADIDSGLARISRYIHRTQVQRLQVEPISQASAKQRAGRCGRLGPGTCIRLYSEEDFAARDAYTPPEVLRSSLAGVILTMLDLGLGDIEAFPFLDPPRPAMIHEGLKELLELGAIRRGSRSGNRSEVIENRLKDGHSSIQLTGIGKKLAKIPIEPRFARMLIAASDKAVLPDALPLVAAMACDDPRRRPIDEREQAAQAHAKWRAPDSDFLVTLNLWKWWLAETKDLSQAKARKLCKANYLSYPKMREWRDLARQLETLAKRLGLSFATPVPAGKSEARIAQDFYARLHQSLLSGLLGRLGCYDEEERNYRGTHAIRFDLHPGSVLAKQLKKAARRVSDDRRVASNQTIKQSDNQTIPHWIMAGELVDTSRLFAREAAVIDPEWIEPVAEDVVKRSYHSPTYEPSSGYVRVTEQVTLYGLVIVPARRRDLSRIDPELAREIFIRSGLVACEFPSPPPVVRENFALIDELRRYGEKTRRKDVLDETKLEAFYHAVIPAEVASADALKKWLRRAKPAEVDAFKLKREAWWPKETDDRRFPDSLTIAGARISLVYRNTPDDPERDGITASVRKRDAAALRLWRSDWLVPGFLGEKVLWMISVLPSALRHILTPLNESADLVVSDLKPGDDTLEDAVRTAVYVRWGARIKDDAWANAKLPPHLKVRFLIRDDATGRPLAVSRDLEEALAKAGVAKGAGLASAKTREAEHATDWIFGDIPEEKSDVNAGWTSTHYPALHDEGDGVTLKLYSDRESADLAHAAATLRLLLIAFGPNAEIPFRRKRLAFDAALYLKDLGYEDARIQSDILAGAVAETYVRKRPAVRTKADFTARILENRAPLVKAQAEIAALVAESAAAATAVNGRLASVPEATAESVSTQLAWLLFPGFARHVPLEYLRRYPRYLKAMTVRLDRAKTNPRGDAEKDAKAAPYWEIYEDAVKPANRAKYHPAALAEFRWMIEEYKVQLFAQELHTVGSVSPKRLEAKLAEAMIV